MLASIVMEDYMPYVVTVTAVIAVLFAVILRQPKRPRAVITQLWVYPIKSCRGVRVSVASFDEIGFKRDRRYMLVRRSEDDGPDVFLHQRVLPRMVLISPEDLPEESGGGLIIRAGGSKVEVPLIGPNEGELRTVRVWDQVFEGAVDQGDSVANFLSDFLGTPVRLVHQPKTCVRPVPPAFRTRGSSNTTSLADGFPFLVATEQSLDDLKQRCGVDLDMRRFRPNVVVRGPNAPYAEDTWKKMTMNGFSFFGVKKCTRCRMTTVNPDDATGNDPELEPLKTMRGFRLESNGDSVCFGLNVVPRWSSRVANQRPQLHVGAELVVEEVGPIRYSSGE